MASYLLQVGYTPEAWAAMIRNPQDRSAAVKAPIEKLGGRIERFWMSFGDYDVVSVVEMPDSVSAAETFTMALLDRQPQITRVGTNTQGVFSDVLVRKLPNGWRFGLPNEVYLTKDGKAFDGVGVPPDIEVSIFPSEDLANGRDSAINKALELLASKDTSSTRARQPGT